MVVVSTIFVQTITSFFQMISRCDVFLCVTFIDNDDGNIHIIRETVHQLCVVDQIINLFIFRFSNKVTVYQFIKLAVVVAGNNDTVFGDVIEVDNFLCSASNFHRLFSCLCRCVFSTFGILLCRGFLHKCHCSFSFRLCFFLCLFL